MINCWAIIIGRFLTEAEKYFTTEINPSFGTKDCFVFIQMITGTLLKS